MTLGPTLLQRFAAAGRGTNPRSVAHRQEAVDSIRVHLRHLLNARQGNAPAQMDLGLPSPHDLLQDFPAGQDRMHEAVRRCIEDYEPRLRQVRVTFEALDELSSAIRFQIHAQMVIDGEVSPINFETTVAAEGVVEIED